jgi:hypothetical protein
LLILFIRGNHSRLLLAIAAVLSGRLLRGQGIFLTLAYNKVRSVVEVLRGLLVLPLFTAVRTGGAINYRLFQVFYVDRSWLARWGETAQKTVAIAQAMTRLLFAKGGIVELALYNPISGTSPGAPFRAGRDFLSGNPPIRPV